MSAEEQGHAGTGQPPHQEETGNYHLVGRRAEVVIISSSAAAGTAEDRCGPLLRDWLAGRGMAVRVHVVPDGPEVLALLRRSVDEWDQTVVMVTHDVTAAAVADRVLLLADGQIAGEIPDPDADAVLAAVREMGRS